MLTEQLIVFEKPTFRVEKTFLYTITFPKISGNKRIFFINAFKFMLISDVTRKKDAFRNRR